MPIQSLPTALLVRLLCFHFFHDYLKAIAIYYDLTSATQICRDTRRVINNTLYHLHLYIDKVHPVGYLSELSSQFPMLLHFAVNNSEISLPPILKECMHAGSIM